MSPLNWQPQSPMNCIIFDCDGTLSTLEGIDRLAEHSGQGDTIAAMTEDAMSKSGLNPELYQHRLELVNPTKNQILTLGEEYYAHCVEDAEEVIQIFKRLNKSIYIISAGLSPSVKRFAELLKIATENVFAVNIQFNSEDNYLDFDRSSCLINKNGKRHIITTLKEKYNNTVFIGDGLNDYEAHDLVTRFIGYGGVFYRKNIQELCEYYIRTRSLSALLPLSLTQQEYESLLPDEKMLYQKGKASYGL
jgi:phosphoserine phosphatase